MEFKAGTQLKIKVEDVSREIQLVERAGKGVENGSPRWRDTRGSLWTEKYLRANAVMVEERGVKNFDKIKVGGWYQDAMGHLIHIQEDHLEKALPGTNRNFPFKDSYGALYSEEGTHQSYSSSKRLLVEVEPIVIKPLPMPKKKVLVEVKRYSNFYPVEGISSENFRITYASKERAVDASFPGAVTVEFVAQVEVEEDQVPIHAQVKEVPNVNGVEIKVGQKWADSAEDILHIVKISDEWIIAKSLEGTPFRFSKKGKWSGGIIKYDLRELIE